MKELDALIGCKGAELTTVHTGRCCVQLRDRLRHALGMSSMSSARDEHTRHVSAMGRQHVKLICMNAYLAEPRAELLAETNETKPEETNVRKTSVWHVLPDVLDLG